MFLWTKEIKNDIVEIEFEELIIDSRFSQNVYLVV